MSELGAGGQGEGRVVDGNTGRVLNAGAYRIDRGARGDRAQRPARRAPEGDRELERRRVPIDRGLIPTVSAEGGVPTGYVGVRAQIDRAEVEGASTAGRNTYGVVSRSGTVRQGDRHYAVTVDGLVRGVSGPGGTEAVHR